MKCTDQGMSQYFFKVLNTQYQYSLKILLNTQYFNTFFHLKYIENTNTNINTQYFQFKSCSNTTMIFMYLESTKDSVTIITAFQSFHPSNFHHWKQKPIFP